MTFTVPEPELAALEEQVRAALRTADDRELTVLGYGEVTLVLRLDTETGSFACKRLPVFPTRERFARYARSLEEYLTRLADAGVRVAPTVLWTMPLPSGKVVAYCVQRALPADRLCSRLLHTEGDAWAEQFFGRLLAVVDGAVGPCLGIDGQAANWVDLDGELVYLDVTTPMLRDERGRERLDVRLFFSSLPWALRDVVRLSMTRSIFDKFYSTRGVLLDFLGNLHKERLEKLVPGFLDQAAARVNPALTVGEVAAYYRDDARMWELIQRLRKADRYWHRGIRRRPYPFLLPPDVDR
ncbi:DUF6206 family protein [Streptomyces oceani]|uniref:Uncharacterized protein n=1 Tax=Streptomyces oceani TaxID=1075402 RepID=A0A1E7KEU7_9ACTN|nr:DUF6206 family protein [Streptomyces oceani]OEV02436.1 hypothetical protein AN216_16245 [Streptomyces oceani]